MYNSAKLKTIEYTEDPAYAIANQIFSQRFLGSAGGWARSYSSTSAFPVNRSISTGSRMRSPLWKYEYVLWPMKGTQKMSTPQYYPPVMTSATTTSYGGGVLRQS